MKFKEIAALIALALSAIVGLIVCYVAGNALLSVIIPITSSFFALFIVIALVKSSWEALTRHNKSQDHHAKKPHYDTAPKKFSELVELKDHAVYSSTKAQLERQLKELGVSLDDDRKE
ncbi:hypothetical protein CDA56_28040 [Klebsiella michiganensis]|uniref:hypothetical protein n=1 Tax=Klebsiella michiganensis TaxID=1134687 RepID=UPI000CE2172F|nr:hypothetical protein [Klebsiella michiganensis]KAB7492672.1 hypothetical protein F7Q97_04500 [Klebsiella michiganensis]MDQ2564291.1 hypothetical protein [Klebsiella michiganensis]PPA45119.1 hypothetical protein CDA56_28040 [Klebsiella michiganensis]HBM3172407.1 hypothetical protein [Klebsiella michiganensis]